MVRYEYTLPDGYILKPETKVRLDHLVDECKLTQEQAQAFVNIHVELMEEAVAAIYASITPPKQAKYHPEGTLEIDHGQVSKRGLKSRRIKLPR